MRCALLLVLACPGCGFLPITEAVWKDHRSVRQVRVRPYKLEDLRVCDNEVVHVTATFRGGERARFALPLYRDVRLDDCRGCGRVDVRRDGQVVNPLLPTALLRRNLDGLLWIDKESPNSLGIVASCLKTPPTVVLDFAYKACFSVSILTFPLWIGGVG